MGGSTSAAGRRHGGAELLLEAPVDAFDAAYRWGGVDTSKVDCGHLGPRIAAAQRPVQVSTATAVHTIPEAHGQYVRVLAWDPFREILISGGGDGHVRFWGPEGRGYAGRGGLDAERSVRSLLVLPEELVSGHSTGEVVLWAMELWGTPRVQTLQAHLEAVYALAMLPSGELVTGAEDMRVFVRSDRDEGAFELAQVVEEEVLCLCVVPGTDLVVSGSVTALLTVWGSSRSWAVAAVCEGHSQPVWAACYLHQVHKCASGGEDHCVRIWSADTWECERVLCGHEGRVAGLSFGQPGWLLSCGSDGTVRAWDCGEWKEVRVFDDQQCEVYCVSPCGGGRFAAGGAGMAIVVYGDAPRAPREECALPPACAVEGLPPSRVEPLPAASGAAAAPLAVCLEEVPAPPGCPTQAARARRAKLVAEMAESPLAKVCEEMRADLAGGAPATPQAPRALSPSPAAEPAAGSPEVQEWSAALLLSRRREDG